MDLKAELLKYCAITLYDECREESFVIYRTTTTYTIIKENEYGEIVLTTQDESSVCVIDPTLSYILSPTKYNRDIIILTSKSGNYLKLLCKKY